MSESIERNAPAEQIEEAVEEKKSSAPGGFAWWQQSLVLFVVFLGLDHLTKYWAIIALSDGTRISVIPGLLAFDYAENTGAAFSILSGQVGVLALISIVASIIIVWLWYGMPREEIWGRMALALIFSGAIGNFIDRAFRGFVVDFIDAYWGANHWPTFNIADSCICVGAAILAVRFLQGKA